MQVHGLYYSECHAVVTVYTSFTMSPQSQLNLFHSINSTAISIIYYLSRLRCSFCIQSTDEDSFTSLSLSYAYVCSMSQYNITNLILDHLMTSKETFEICYIVTCMLLCMHVTEEALWTPPEFSYCVRIS